MIGAIFAVGNVGDLGTSTVLLSDIHDVDQLEVSESLIYQRTLRNYQAVNVVREIVIQQCFARNDMNRCSICGFAYAQILASGNAAAISTFEVTCLHYPDFEA